MAQLSVSDSLHGSTILLTGGLGFLGSVATEQILRQTEVKRVFLLVRGKKQHTPQQRVERLLSGPLFHMLHEQAAAPGGRNPFCKVQAVEGDMELPGLGLSDADRQLLIDEVDVVIHSAACLTLDAHIQNALRANYCGTRQLLALAREMHHLRSFVHVSTYFVANHLPTNTPVPEEVQYPTLQLAGDPRHLSHDQLTSVLLGATRDTAAAEVSHIMSRLGFISTYAFSKLLTEQLVDDPATLPGVCKSIVRPSLISSIAGAPYPGYISGYAGSPGYCLAYGMGCFHDLSMVAFASDAVIDLIPVDTTAALVVASAAAGLTHATRASSDEGRARVYCAASAHSYPQSAPSLFERANKWWTLNPSPFKLPLARLPTYSGRHYPTAASMWRGTMITSAKVWAACLLLKWTGKSRQAAALQNGFKAFLVQNTPGYARSIISRVDNARELLHSMSPEERTKWPCVWEEGPNSSWESYSWTGLAGLRAIALRLPESSVVGIEHGFSSKQGLTDPSLMAEWMAASSPPSPSSRSSRSSSSGQPDSPTAIATVTISSSSVVAMNNSSSSKKGVDECGSLSHAHSALITEVPARCFESTSSGSDSEEDAAAAAAAP